MPRRAFLRGCGGLSALPLARGAGAATEGRGGPATGLDQPSLAGFDRLMTSFVTERKVPGAALAVTRHGRLVYARGFGYADVEHREPVRPRALFRIASVSKPFTAVAVLQLVERGQLALDEPVFRRLEVRWKGEPVPAADPRLERVTVRQLLQHTGGWDRDKSFDPMFRPVRVAREMGVEPPAGPAAIVAYMWRRPLDFDPGARYAYSNFGYSVLGRLVEKVTGLRYEEYVREKVLAPLKIHAMRLGRTLPQGRAPGEVRYYAPPDRAARGVLPPFLGKPVAWPYGGWSLEALDAHGGWIASAPDLVRFASAFDDPARCPLLDPRGVKAMFARPPGLAGHTPKGKPRASYYACGWDVRPVGDRGANTWHSGSLDGTSALLVRRFDGLNWAALFNSREKHDGDEPAEAIDGLLHEAADAVKEWPGHDLFARGAL
jgi:N-acyl-D-amino-acid deacylase